jgi:hypothetical protein
LLLDRRRIDAEPGAGTDASGRPVCLVTDLAAGDARPHEGGAVSKMMAAVLRDESCAEKVAVTEAS